MVYKIDYVDGDVLRWSVTETGVECEVDESYTPTIYVSVHGDGDFRRHVLHSVTILLLFGLLSSMNA